MEGAAGLESYCLSGDARVGRLSWMKDKPSPATNSGDAWIGVSGSAG